MRALAINVWVVASAETISCSGMPVDGVSCGAPEPMLAHDGSDIVGTLAESSTGDGTLVPPIECCTLRSGCLSMSSKLDVGSPGSESDLVIFVACVGCIFVAVAAASEGDDLMNRWIPWPAKR